MGSNILLIVAALLLVLLNGFFVAAEFGLVKLRATRVKAIVKRYGWRGRLLAKVHGNLDAYLSACQLGITLASLGLGWIGEPAFASLLEPLLNLAGIHKAELVHGISFIFAFFTISYLHIVVGELAPKSMAIRKPEQIGLWTAAPLYGFYWLMYPGIWLLNHSANQVLRLLRLDGGHAHDSEYSSDELKLILRTSRSSDDFSSDEWRVLAHALDFRELDVADLMRPFGEVVALSLADTLEANIERMVQQRYSRYPLLNAEGAVVGVIHLKDVFFAMQRAGLPESLAALARPVVTISPELSAMALFRRFRGGAPHFAVVTHADGQPVGFVTLDNLLAALVGEIRDEYRQTQNDWIRLDDGSLMGKGSLAVFTLERALGIDIEQDVADSVGGLILWKLGDLPREGQRIEFTQFDAVVKKMTGPRIVLVRIYPKLGGVRL
ncbi:hemolysin family protein [Andreprevotia chitinilytica]|uniref:hemolysin family protein n=1 Tax=Andreprevotia chitinilytica TaxID=396808 RepID=UPI0005535D23|nr:hemolysin family protein [Andreprevotia chitinilytica]